MPMFMTDEIGATEMLKQEHRQIKDLFRQFDDAVSDRQKKSIGDAALSEIEDYARLAEEVFYPAVRRQIGERRLIVEAEAAHGAAKRLIKELKGLSAGERYNSRFDLLQNGVLQQFDEEQSELLPRVERSDLDLERLGREMLQMKTRIAQSQKAFLSSTGAVTLGLMAVGALAWLVSGNNQSKTQEPG